MRVNATRKVATNGEVKRVIEITPRKKKVLSEKQKESLAKGRWKPGQSGNPLGPAVMKNISEVVALARTYTTAAIERLGKILESHDIPASCRAADILLERAWGKAPQVVELTGEGGGPVQSKVVVELPQANILAPQVLSVLTRLGIVPKLVDAAAKQIVVDSGDQKLLADYEQLNK